MLAKTTISLIHIFEKKYVSEEIVKPMKEELTSIGFNELLTRDDVNIALEKAGTTLIVVNLFVVVQQLMQDLEFIYLFKIIKSQTI